MTIIDKAIINTNKSLTSLTLLKIADLLGYLVAKR